MSTTKRGQPKTHSDSLCTIKAQRVLKMSGLDHEMLDSVSVIYKCVKFYDELILSSVNPGKIKDVCFQKFLSA